jgi:hypothetical protein
MISSYNTIPAKHFVQVLAANVDNENMSDEAFRELVRNTVSQVEGGQGTQFNPNEFRPGVRVYRAVENTPE